ncbi:inclusion membrane protein GarD [Chlamydia trachomatis]|uniref:Uncharacterized protein n=2 Tax=Chlamydia trachomatis TaxID=813 RepID=O84137_CHLTR|nr:hypothetical protein [Chlamydia trachomatis]NP_219638.1 hypothetical protein CT_135 [Chlamydia trachomatis D/UW-3/CX]EHC8555172.1 hypothetical protein [Salmonella enterica subsp. enterica serovar Enteritidis]AAC67726.1 hypothetical protein CT_135 [Chlamydia trachomatis D/UW-3/CX]ADH16902.1 hypothetical protein E150_00715 [Chlamydia trachomatis E/150]ADH17825.1 hypothetical protein G9768_00695 [Chlamydia trachomatis G/9768]ADH18744.1 hypothetical protein G11222_00700 [Chlamydia trachomatis 
MVSFDLNDPVRNTDNHYRNINRMLNSATCAAGGIGLLTPVVCSPMGAFCFAQGPSSAEDLGHRIQHFVACSGPAAGFYSLSNERIMFEEAAVPSVLEAVEATFWISAFARLRGNEPSTCDTVMMSCVIGCISLVCGAMFVAIVSCAVKISRIVRTMTQAHALRETIQRQLAARATDMRSAYSKLKGIIAIRALNEVERGHRKLRNKMITAFVANALITLAFCALLASAVIAAFFFGAASAGLASVFFGCLWGGIGALAVGVLVGIVSGICQRNYKVEAARCIQRGALYALVLEKMQRFPKEFLKDGVAKSVVAIQAGESLDTGELAWEEMPSITACLGREGMDAQAYSFLSASPLDARIE